MHTFHKFSVILNAVRMYYVSYMRGDGEQVGLIDCLFHMSRLKCQHYLLIRRMIPLEPEHGNRKVVECYSHQRLTYELDADADVWLGLVHVRDVISLFMIVVYPYRFEVDCVV